MLASDGHNYRISVTFGPDSGIPDDATLEATEIIEGLSAYGKSYAEYVAGTENALGMEEGSAHVHTEECFGLMQIFELDHEHTNNCFAEGLICQLAAGEGHVHTLECMLKLIWIIPE